MLESSYFRTEENQSIIIWVQIKQASVSLKMYLILDFQMELHKFPTTIKHAYLRVSQ